MKLTDFRIGTPLLAIDVRIHHATPRKPTAFERVILSMVDRFSNDESFNAIPLDRIFEDILCVPGPTPIVAPTLAELTALDVIRCTGDIDRLDILRLQDIEITARGKIMIAEDMLPAKSMQNDEPFFFDPISQHLISRSESQVYRAAAPRLSIDATPFENVFPHENIRKAVESGGFRWFGSSSRIEKLEPTKSRILWKDSRSTIAINDGLLSVDATNEHLREYIAMLPESSVVERFIDEVFAAPNYNPEDFPSIDGCHPEDSDQVLSIQRATDSWPEDARFVAVSGPELPDAASSGPATRQSIVLVDNSAPDGQLQVSWDDEGNGCVIRIAGFEWPKDLIRVTNSSTTLGRRVEGRFGREICRFGVALVTTSGDTSYSIIEKVSACFDRAWETISPKDRTALSMMTGKESFLQTVMRHSKEESDSLANWAQSHFSAIIQMETIAQPVPQSVTESVLIKLLLDSIRNREVDVGEVDGLVDVLANNRRYLGKSAARIRDALALIIPQPRNDKEYNAVIELLNPLDDNWEDEFPSHLFNTDLCRFALDVWPEVPEFTGPANGFTKALNLLKASWRSLSDATPGLEPDSCSDEGLTIAVKTDAGKSIPAACGAWFEAYNSLGLIVAEMEVDLSETSVGRFHRFAVCLSQHAAKLIGSLDSRITRVYVLDTCALIDHPEIAERPSGNELLVVTKRVIDELDDKKLDESLRMNVGRAVRNIRSLSEDQVRFEDGDMSLLPTDYRSKGDNLILSVAVRFKTHGPVLVTNDNNLSLKAKAEGLSPMTSSDFLKRPRTHSKQTSRATRNGASEGVDHE